jgi:FkbM family methyltransferase
MAVAFTAIEAGFEQDRQHATRWECPAYITVVGSDLLGGLYHKMGALINGSVCYKRQRELDKPSFLYAEKRKWRIGFKLGRRRAAASAARDAVKFPWVVEHAWRCCSTRKKQPISISIWQLMDITSCSALRLNAVYQGCQEGRLVLQTPDPVRYPAHSSLLHMLTDLFEKGQDAAICALMSSQHFKIRATSRSDAFVVMETYKRTYAPWKRAAYKKFGPQPGYSWLDLGGNNGAFARWVLSMGARHVTSIEPSAETAELLRINLTGFPAVVHEVAVSIDSGAASPKILKDLSQTKNGSMRSSLLETSKYPCPKGTLLHLVKTIPFKCLLTDQHDAIKMDIEGADIFVLDKKNDFKRVKLLWVEVSAALLRKMYPSGVGWKTFARILKHLKHSGFVHIHFSAKIDTVRFWTAKHATPSSDFNMWAYRKQCSEELPDRFLAWQKFGRVMKRKWSETFACKHRTMIWSARRRQQRIRKR